MFFLLSLPISLTSLILYLFLTFLGNGFWVWTSGLILSFITIIFIFRNYFKNTAGFKKFLSLKNLSLIFLILFFVFCKAYVLSPLVVIKQTGSFKHIQITDVGDYYKHTFVVNALRLDGIPPHHPYFPQAKLSYYFGYYLIPAAFSKLFNILPNLSFYIFFIVTDILGLMIILNVFNNHLKTYVGKLFAVLLLFAGVGVNVFPEILSKFPLLGFNISPDAFSTQTGFQLINNYKAFLYVPQHFFTACLTVGLLNEIIFKKPRFVIAGIIISFIFLSSLFVSWTLILWLLLVFIFYPKKRPVLIFSIALSFFIFLPYLGQLTPRGGLFSLNRFQPFRFIKDVLASHILNTFFNFIIQYGLIVFSLVILIIFRKKTFFKNNLFFILGLSLPLIVTWFVRTPNFNDFSMRGLMPIQLILPLIFTCLYERLKNKFSKIFLVIVLLVVLLSGFLAFYLEYSRHWKARMILHPSVSELFFEVRKIPDSVRIAAIDRDRWVEFIPSIGFKKVLSPYLFDSYVYFVGDLTAAHGNYERVALDLFIEPNIGRDLKSLIEQKNMHFSKLHTFFNSYSADWLILNNQLWVKQDLNPWLALFSKMGIKTKPLTSNYTLVDFQSLLEKTSKYDISISENALQLPVKEKGVLLDQGFWYLASCSDKKGQLVLEFEDYYLLFNQEVDGNNKACVGKIFYLQKKENVKLTQNSNVSLIYAFPIKF